MDVQEEVGNSDDEYEGESEEEQIEILLPTSSDIEAHAHIHPHTRTFIQFFIADFKGTGVANYLQTPIQLGARQPAVNKARGKTSVLELDIDGS